MRLLPPRGPDERCAAIVFVVVTHGLGDVDPLVGHVHLLARHLLRENGEQVLSRHGLACLGVERRQGFGWHDRRNVEPLSWDIILGQEITFLL